MEPKDYDVLRRNARGGMKKVEVFRDVYFDTKERALTLRNWWLRRRGENYELKVPTSAGDACACEEITDEAAIMKRLGEIRGEADPDESFADCPPGVADWTAERVGHDAGAGSQNGGETRDGDRSTGENSGDPGAREKWLTPLCDLITRRETFGTADPGVRIDVDLVNFGVERDGTTLPFEGGEFSICEFEVMAECGDAAEVERAKRRIEAVRNGMGLGHCPEGRSKVIEFLDRYSPDHYAAIVEARKGGGPEKASRKRTGPGSDEKDVPGHESGERSS